LENAGCFPSFEFGVQRTWKVACSHQNLAWFLLCIQLSKVLVLGHFWQWSAGIESVVDGDVH